MKTLFRIFLLSLLVLLAACEEEVSGAFLPVPDANGYVTCSMELNGGVVAYEGATRSSNGYEWNDGDRLYIRFATDNDTVLGYANYDGNKAEWQVSYAGSLKSGVTKGCEVYFFENATHKDNTTVELTVLSAIYQDTAAVYRFESNTVLLNATLHPKTGRVRFVSQNRDEFSLAGIRYYIGFDLSNKEFNLNYRRRLVLNAHQLQNNGEYSTDYLYGFYEENYDGSVRKEVPLGLDIINHADTSKVYHKDFAVEMLNAGNSGYITLPSESVNQGWSVDKFNGGRYFAKWKYRGPEMYADGGILYGVLLNGNVIFDYDDSWYYCWGDRDSDGDYLTDGKYYTGTGSISKTMYDLAYAWYNDNAYMPTKSAVSQMLSLNRYSNFCLVSDDFNVLALGTTYGYEDLDSSEDYDVESKYLWTASAVNSTNAYAAVFTDNGYEIKSMHKKYGMGFLITFDNELANNDNDHRNYNGINNGYEYADLGLPSGTMWATCNVGATKPEEYGGYYAWGETEEKEDYSWETYKWCNGSETSITKYCTASSYGTVDNKTVLDLEDDVAHVKWGSNWRMPTTEEQQELLDNCNWTWITHNGVKGYKVTSKTNGNSIFLPAAGYFGDTVANGGSHGNYWSANLAVNYGNGAFGNGFSVDYYRVSTALRNYGRSVRPVYGEYDEPEKPTEKPEGTYISESFATSFGSFTTQQTVGNYPWVIDYSTAKATSYVDGANNEAVSWLISSPVDFTNETEAYVAFDYIIRYPDSESLAANHQLLISDDYTDDVAEATWVDVPYGAVEGSDWSTFYKASVNVPAEFLGKENITFALRYMATTKSSTWEVKNFVVAHGTVEENKPAETGVYTVAQAIAAYTGTAMPIVVKGYIVGSIDDKSINDANFSNAAVLNTNLLIADNVNETDVTKCLPVQLPSGDVREALNLVDNPGNYKKQVVLTGSLEKYFDVAGLKSVTEYVIYNTVTVSSEGGGSVAISGTSGTSATFEDGSSVTVVATPDDGYVFEGWYVEETGSLVSSKTEYSFTVNGDVALVAKFDVLVYEAVDLGLPSGLKWATCNVGASAPEEYGGYYAWGETEEKSNYSWSTYKWCNGSSSTMTKYCTSSSYGTVDNKTLLDPEDDVAYVKWGGSWRMPTLDEQKELLNNCTWTWTTQNGVNGYRVTSKTNGNSIFLPAAGYRSGTEVYFRGSSGSCWSSSLYSSLSHYAYGLFFNSGSRDWNDDYRYCGRSVRPVHGERTVTKYTVSVSSDGNGSVSINGNSGTSAMFEDGSTVTVVATPDEGYVFECWCEPETGEIFSEDAEYAFTVSEDVALTARFDVDLSAYYYIRNVYFTDKYAALNSSTKKIEPKAKGTTDNYLWSFVKNVDGTIRIYNKANGEAAYVENAADDQAVLVGKEYDWTLVETTNDLGNKGIGIVSANGSSAWYTNPTSWSYILTKPYTWGGSVWTLEKSNVRVETSIE